MTPTRTRAFEPGDTSLDPRWIACLARADPGSRFHTPGWYRTWLRTYGARHPWAGRGRVLVAESAAGEPIGVLPLAQASKRGLRVLCLAGFFQPIRTAVLDVARANDAAVALVDALRDGPTGYHFLRLGPLDLSAPGHHTLLDRLRLRFPRVEVRPQEPLIVLHDLPGDFQDYKARVLGNAFVKDIRYYERRLVREGGMEIRHYRNPGGDDLETMLADCRGVEGRSWLGKAAKLAQASPQFAARPRFATEHDFRFWRGIAAEALAPGDRLDAWIMDFGGKPVSFSLTLTVAGVRYMIANQYDEDYFKYSTGSVLYFHVLEDACASGVRAVDFGNGDLHYKGRWGGVACGERAELIIFSATPTGRVLAGARRAFQGLRAALGSARALTHSSH